MHLRARSTRILAAAAVAAGGVALTAQPAAADSARVTNDSNAGPGSFRAAVEAANADSSIDTITFRRGLHVDLSSPVAFTGSQDLTINGRGGSVSGASVAPDTDSWDSGLFVASGGGDLTLRRIGFHDSFNNGVAIFLPAAGDDVDITLDRVTVTDAQFHGILIDGQSTTGYNTDDIIHINCEDPYAVDSGSSIDLDVDRTAITGAGQLAGGYDISLLDGCPQDFDGLRVDQGADGDITGSMSRGTFDSNLADGVELDEKGAGGVDVEVSRTSFSSNGVTEEIECTGAYLAALELVDPSGEFDRCTEGDMLADLDDGFDIDEEDEGDMVARVNRLTVNGNQDEGLDFDEAGDGSIDVTVERVTAIGNRDEALKASEEDAGDVTVKVTRSTFFTEKDDGTQLEEEGEGSIDVTIERSTITGKDGEGVKVEEQDDGDLTVDVSRSSLVDSDPDAGILVNQEDSGSGSLTIDRSDLTGNTGGAINNEGGVDTVVVTRTSGV